MKIIIWKDKKSVMMYNKKLIKAGDVVPADVLSKTQIEKLIKDKKIIITEDGKLPVEESVVKFDKIFTKSVELITFNPAPKKIEVEKKNGKSQTSN
jgi:outer membrane lipoprotein-sorting protein